MEGERAIRRIASARGRFEGVGGVQSQVKACCSLSVYSKNTKVILVPSK